MYIQDEEAQLEIQVAEVLKQNSGRIKIQQKLNKGESSNKFENYRAVMN